MYPLGCVEVALEDNTCVLYCVLKTNVDILKFHSPMTFESLHYFEINIIAIAL